MAHGRSVLLLALLAWAGTAGAYAQAMAAAPEAEARPMDFSHVTSRAKAEALVRRGDLVRIRPFPARFGGPDDDENRAYVPPGAQVALDAAHDRISGLIDLGSIDRMTVNLEYRTSSVVPSAIVYTCRGKGKGSVMITVNIW